MQKEFDEYSLWIELPQCEYAIISGVIERIAKALRTVIFEPHITLLGDIPFPKGAIEARMRSLAGSGPLPIVMTRFGIGENHYKCLIAECEKSEGLMTLNRRAQNMFAMNAGYEPHLSLMYGNATLKVKEALREKLRAEKLLPLSFQADTVSLWHIKGPADQWKKICQVSLR